MLTLFTAAKPFRGHTAITQRSALRSWMTLHRDVQIILFGDEMCIRDSRRSVLAGRSFPLDAIA